MGNTCAPEECCQRIMQETEVTIDRSNFRKFNCMERGQNAEVVVTPNGTQNHSKKQSIVKNNHNSKASFGSYRGSQSSLQHQRA